MQLIYMHRNAVSSVILYQNYTIAANTTITTISIATAV